MASAHPDEVLSRPGATPALREPLKRLYTIRIVVCGLLVIAAPYVARQEPPLAWALGLVFSLILAWAVFKRWRFTSLELTTARLRRTFIVVVLLQTCIIALTGGILSPLIIAYVPSITIASIVSGSRRVVLPAFLTACGSIALLWGLHFWSVVQLPDISDAATATTFAIVIPIVVAFGMITALEIRGALTDSLREEARARARAIAALTERNAQLVTLSSTLAHELKNPLTAIQGLSMTLARNANEGSAESERLDVVVKEVKRMGTILDDFLTFSRPIGPINPAPLELHRTIAELAALFRDEAAARGVVLKVTSTGPVWVRCDHDQIQTVLVNTLRNAIDACVDGGTVTLGTTQVDDEITVTVEDDGVGLSDDVGERAFDFGVSTKESGSGIGLALSRTIVAAHGGEISLTPSRPRGARLQFTLPAAGER